MDDEVEHSAKPRDTRSVSFSFKLPALVNDMMEQLAYLGTHPTVPTIVVRAPLGPTPFYGIIRRALYYLMHGRDTELHPQSKSATSTILMPGSSPTMWTSTRPRFKLNVLVSPRGMSSVFVPPCDGLLVIASQGTDGISTSMSSSIGRDGAQPRTKRARHALSG